MANCWRRFSHIRCNFYSKQQQGIWHFISHNNVPFRDIREIAIVRIQRLCGITIPQRHICMDMYIRGLRKMFVQIRYITMS